MGDVLRTGDLYIFIVTIRYLAKPYLVPRGWYVVEYGVILVCRAMSELVQAEQ